MDSGGEDYEGSWRGVPGSIILINVYDELNVKSAAIAHAAICGLVKQCLRMSSSYNIGVSLFGTVGGSSAFSIKGIEDIIPLTVPNLDEFKKLQNVDMNKYPHASELILSDALWHCSKIFANSKKLFSSRTVILLSRLDTPPIESDWKPSLKRVVDLVDSNIDIRVLNISETEYKIHQFYEDFLNEINKGRAITPPKHVWNVSQIQLLLFQHAHRHLAVTQLNMEIGSELSIGVGVYSLLKSQTYNKKTNVDRETNAVLTSLTKTAKITIEQDNEESETENMEAKEVPLLKSELLFYQEYGGERVEFSDSEMKKIKNPFGPPVIKLLGFKPLSILSKEKWYLKPCYFLYPNEKHIEGSTKAFKALHQACVETQMVAICVLCTRVNSNPRIVALTPSSHPLGLDVEIGFDIISIPFMENLRMVPVEEIEEDVSNTQKTYMKKLLQSVKFEYVPEMFENPKVQCEYRAIEAIALEEEDIEPFKDTTIPDIKVFQTIEENLFQQLFGPFEVKSLKRNAVPKESGANSKRIRKGIDKELLENKISNKTVASYSVQDLKDILKSKNIPDLPALTGVPKKQLVEFVYKYFKQG